MVVIEKLGARQYRVSLDRAHGLLDTVWFHPLTTGLEISPNVFRSLASARAAAAERFAQAKIEVRS
jgi:hypothetical protein